MTYTKIIGLDLSLTSTGVALIELEATGDRPATRAVTTLTVASKGRRGDTLEDRHARLVRLVHHIGRHASGADLVVIEAPSLGQSRQVGTHDRSGLWWFVVDGLVSIGTPVAIVPPASRAKYACGKGNGSKDQVLAAVVRRYIDVEVTGNDEADALVLAAMGARHLGIPIEASLPVAQLAAMDGVEWPADGAA